MNNKYSRYKSSGSSWLGKIPGHWSEPKFKRVAELLYGDSLPSRKRNDGTVPVYGSNGITDYHSVAITGEPCIIVGRKGSYGKVNYSSVPCFPIDTTFYIDPSATENCLRWVYYLLLSLRLDSYSKDSAVPGINRGEIRSRYVPLPSIEEQHVIADYLDRKTQQIDTLIARKQRLIELLQEQRTAIINRAVTKGLDPDAPMKDSGIEWLGEVPAHWGTGKLRYVTNLIQTGPFGSQLHARDYIENGLPVINPSNLINGNVEPDRKKTITDEIANRLSRHRLSEGDIVFARRGEMGRCALVGSAEEGWLCGTGSIKVELQQDSVVSRYMSIVLSTLGVSEWLQLQSVGSTMSNLNTDIVSAIPVPIPPRNEQEEIAEYVSKRSEELNRVINRTTEEMGLLQELRTSLISEVVTGKIDVREETAVESPSFETEAVPA